MLSKDRFHKEVGKRIKDIREKKGLSLRELEMRDISIDRAHLSKIENGEKVIQLYTLYKIASALEVDINDFLKK